MQIPFEYMIGRMLKLQNWNERKTWKNNFNRDKRPSVGLNFET